MTDARKRPNDVELRRIIMREIAYTLSMFYTVEVQLPPRLRAFLQRLDHAQNRMPPQLVDLHKQNHP
jgi:hypothetical protein